MRRFAIGRSQQNDIVIEDSSVSRRHAELRELGSGWYKMVDLGSTHGTHVERGGLWNKVTVAEVTRGNRVRFGKYERSVDSLLDAALVVKPERRNRQSANTTMMPKSEPRSSGRAIAACVFAAVGVAAVAAFYFMPS
ncbi:MAG: FHA domain-containing protein [Pseudomonadota bacterium]